MKYKVAGVQLIIVTYIKKTQETKSNVSLKTHTNVIYHCGRLSDVGEVSNL